MSNNGRNLNAPPGLSNQEQNKNNSSNSKSKTSNNENNKSNNDTKTSNNNINSTTLKKSTKSFLRPNAPEFDVRNSPTIDPYGHPLGVSTRPEYVPPCNTPPMQQPSNQQQTRHFGMNNHNYRGSNGYRYPPHYPMMDPHMSRDMALNVSNMKNLNLGNQSNGSDPRNNNHPSTFGPKNPMSKNTPLSFHGGYKTPSRSYGKPKDDQIDRTFQNPPNLLHYQKWELLESAKRWLPGEGTVTTYNGYRYFLGAPIHMGMNGHIHYCYRYKIPNNDNKHQPESVESVAAKVVPNTSAFAREIVILRALQGCENITKLYEVLESKRTLISILELAQADVYSFFVGRGALRHGWSLEKPAVREAFARMVVTNAVQGLKQMHDNEYLHCDLKSLNILLYIYKTDRATKRGGVYMKAKLTDFGHSSHGKIRRSEATFRNGMARVGTAGHVAPELFKEGSPCDYKIDIWSLGIVMFSMLVPNKLLFSEYTNLETLKKNYDRLYKMNPYSKDRPSWWTDFERLSPEARDLILWMTQFKPKDRPNGEQILAHPWFQISKGNLKPGEYRPNLRYVHMLSISSIAQE